MSLQQDQGSFYSFSFISYFIHLFHSLTLFARYFYAVVIVRNISKNSKNFGGSRAREKDLEYGNLWPWRSQRNLLKLGKRTREAIERKRERWLTRWGHDLKANTSRLSSQWISTRFTKRGEFLWRSVAAIAVAVQLLNRPSLLARAIIGSFYLRPTNLSTLWHRPSFSRRILLNKYLSLLRCRHAHVRVDCR